MTSEADVRDSHGYSIGDPIAKAGWIELITSIRSFLEENDLTQEIVFHGTSARRAQLIVENGMKPTEVEHAVWSRSQAAWGSFWGTIDAAASYAEDAASIRDAGELPVILAVPVAELAAACELLPDGATFDFPMKGLTKLDDPQILEKWHQQHATLDWDTSLKELGAIVALHQKNLKLQAIAIVGDLDTLKEMCVKPKIRP